MAAEDYFDFDELYYREEFDRLFRPNSTVSVVTRDVSLVCIYKVEVLRTTDKAVLLNFVLPMAESKRGGTKYYKHIYTEVWVPKQYYSQCEANDQRYVAQWVVADRPHVEQSINLGEYNQIVNPAKSTKADKKRKPVDENEAYCIGLFGRQA